ncbi:hypothetical protein HPB48_000466 [Haemaphysalis longicornis]|uniref:Tick transposon n=1 Tax=Haemaphysalis longicornis TaxID=44386 RepID=A0A9J6GAP1_HAELO|nr:hypothetical protein HPB48_000466 [Haemaphysalis longicornis]
MVLHLLLPALVNPSLDFAWNGTLPPCESEAGAGQYAITAAAPLLATTLPDPPTLTSTWTAPSQPTSSLPPAIKEQRPSAALRGLGSCATSQRTYRFALVMQVSRYNSLFAKKTSNYYLVQLPSPQCLCEIILECAHTTSSLLLLLSGDVETNPGPEMQEILTELQKISAGQATLLTEVQELKNQLSTTNQTITDLSKRMTEVENHYQNLSPLQADLEVIRTDTTETNRLVSELEAKLDDAENRSRRNNLIFYNLPDPNPAETNAEAEGLIIRHCLEHLQVAIDPKEIDRAHRLGRHAANRNRPIIAKFTFH